MHIRCTLPNSFDEEVIHQTYDTGLFGLIEAIFRSFIAFGQNILSGGQGLERISSNPVMSSDELSEISLVCKDEFNVHVGQEPKFIECGQFKGVAGGHSQGFTFTFNRHALLLEDQTRWKQLKCFLGHITFGEIHDGHRELLTDRFEDIITLDIAKTYQDPIQPLASSGLCLDGLIELITADQAAFLKE